jgi:hypothetical protein
MARLITSHFLGHWSISSPLGLEAHAKAARAGVSHIEEHDPGFVKSRLDCVERARSRICSAAFQILDGDFGHSGRLGEVRLRPVDEHPFGDRLRQRIAMNTLVERGLWLFRA